MSKMKRFYEQARVQVYDPRDAMILGKMLMLNAELMEMMRQMQHGLDLISNSSASSMATTPAKPSTSSAAVAMPEFPRSKLFK